MEYTEKFIAFIDVLGFKAMVCASEKGDGISLAQIDEHLQKFGTSAEVKRYQDHGPLTCPESVHISPNLDFMLTQVSDCVVVSAEVSPAGLINLVGHCWGSVTELAVQGIMCRGYVTRGMIYHTETQFIGTGYQNAFAKEAGVTAFKKEADERGTPFVELDSTVCSYVETSKDGCVMKMFDRMTKTEDGVTALFPFQQLSHSFVIDGFGQESLDSDKEISTLNINFATHF